mgnify:CR=1 FL=1
MSRPIARYMKISSLSDLHLFQYYDGTLRTHLKHSLFRIFSEGIYQNLYLKSQEYGAKPQHVHLFLSVLLKKGLDILRHQSPIDGKVLLVSHGMAITGILKLIDPQSTLYRSVENATVSRLWFGNEEWKIESIGESLSE